MAHCDADIAMRRYRAGPLNILIFKKLAGLWWAGEVLNHVWIYGSKVAEGSSAFQRRSCIDWFIMAKFKNNLIICLEMKKIYIGCKCAFIYYLFLFIYLFIISYLFLIS